MQLTAGSRAWRHVWTLVLIVGGTFWVQVVLAPNPRWSRILRARLIQVVTLGEWYCVVEVLVPIF